VIVLLAVVAAAVVAVAEFPDEVRKVAPSCNKGESLFATTDSDGRPIHGNSAMGHSLEGTPGAGKSGVIGRMLTEDERFDLIEYLKTL
jgi:hypothetical protein